MDNEKLQNDPVLGAVIGDIVGSRFEFNHRKSPKNFNLFTEWCKFTDDTVLTLAVTKALMENKEDHSNLRSMAVRYMVQLGRDHMRCGFGPSFENWLWSYYHEPYNSYGNGAAMRVSACGVFGKTEEETKQISEMVTDISHNHPDGIRGAEAAAMMVYLIRKGKTKEEIKEYFIKNYYGIDFTVSDLQSNYGAETSCSKTVPQAFVCFLESEDFEDAIRNAISIGGDTDTIAAICGSMAAMYYGIPDNMKEQALKYLSDDLVEIYTEYNSMHLLKKTNSSIK